MSVHSVNNRGTATPAVYRTRTDPLESVLHGGKLLKCGSSGPEVRALQRLLNSHGARLAEDGVFGPKTEAAVRGFQRSHGLEPDGVVGSKTAPKLMSDPRSEPLADRFEGIRGHRTGIIQVPVKHGKAIWV